MCTIYVSRTILDLRVKSIFAFQTSKISKVECNFHSDAHRHQSVNHTTVYTNYKLYIIERSFGKWRLIGAIIFWVQFLLLRQSIFNNVKLIQSK